MTAPAVRTAPPQTPTGAMSASLPPETEPQATAVSSKQRRGDVEGLRAIAVLAVVAFHGTLPWAPGGFVGVDIFFVISGFLITGLMLQDVARHGRVRLGDFYARRARRILPPAALVVLLTVLAAAVIRPPLATMDVTHDAAATLLYVANWWFLHQQTDYLASSASPSPLLHFWSLSVEEQFYLVWPLLILGVALLFRGRPRRRTVAVLAVAMLIGAASFALCLSWTATVEPRAYLATPTRAWQFMAGAVLAIGSPALVRGAARLRRRAPRGPEAAQWVLGVGGLLALAWSILMLDGGTAYPGLVSLVPTVGTAAVILAGTLDGATPHVAHRAARSRPHAVPRLLARPPLRALGRVSYAWYLWHWPVVVLAPYALGDAREPAVLPWPVLCLLSFASLAPAWASMRLVEDPVRFARAFASPERGLAVGAAAVALPLAVTASVSSLARADSAPPEPRLSHRQLVAAMTGPVTDAGGGDVVPAPAAAGQDQPDRPDCLIDPAEVSWPDDCTFGATESTRRIVLLGDSHAAQWLSPIADIARRAGYRVDLRAKASCNAADYDVDSQPLGRLYTECRDWRTRVLQELAADPPELVVLASYNAAGRPTWKAGWDRSLRRILATGTRAVYLRPTPVPNFDVPTCLSGALDDWSRCALPIAHRGSDPVADAIARGRYPGASLVDLSRYLCSDRDCPAVRDHVLVYRDGSHLTDTAVRGLEPVLNRALRPLLRS